MKEIARVLYGSQNYGLDSPDSDKDYKVLLCPSFYDMYNMKKVSTGDMEEGYDKEHELPMDVRQFDNLVHKCNPNVLEMVFSIEWHYNNKKMREYISRAKELLSFGWIALNWDNFYAATMGMALNSLKRYGANPKAVSRGWYLYYLTLYIADYDFYMCTDSWRDNWFSNVARELRFGPAMPSDEEYKKIAEEIMNKFHNSKDELANKAREWVKDNPEKVAELKERAAALSEQMKNIVLSEMLGDFGL